MFTCDHNSSYFFNITSMLFVSLLWMGLNVSANFCRRELFYCLDHQSRCSVNRHSRRIMAYICFIKLATYVFTPGMQMILAKSFCCHSKTSTTSPLSSSNDSTCLRPTLGLIGLTNRRLCHGCYHRRPSSLVFKRLHRILRESAIGV